MVSNVKGIMVDGTVQLVDYTALANLPEITSEYSPSGTNPVNGQAVASAVSGKLDSEYEATTKVGSVSAQKIYFMGTIYSGDTLIIDCDEMYTDGVEVEAILDGVPYTLQYCPDKEENINTVTFENAEEGEMSVRYVPSDNAVADIHIKRKHNLITDIESVNSKIGDIETLLDNIIGE